MEQNEQLSLSWDAHQKSICTGLSQLQQRGEFVDMTLAADGHHVKVHQMVMSLVSPYIKDLLSTTNSPHPIIFLNNISYTTLCAILEYIYTGEILVSKYQLKDVIAAGKALHIRGLKEMDVEKPADPDPITETNLSTPKSTSLSERLRQLKKNKKLEPLPSSEETPKEGNNIVPPTPMCKIYLDDNTGWTTMGINDTSMDIPEDSTEVEESTLDTSETQTHDSSNIGISDQSKDIHQNKTTADTRNALLNAKVQYTISNQGGLQSICNRYMYQLRYISRDRKVSWRCIDYNKTRCKANICTNVDDEVVDRTFNHNHPFHDKNILRKHHIGIIFSNFKDASIKSRRRMDNIPIPQIMDEEDL